MPFAAVSAWDTDTDRKLGISIALERVASGASLAVYRNDTGDVYLRFRTRPGQLPSRAMCPTFQIDDRTPVHHVAPGPACAIEGRDATYHLATIAGGATESLSLYRLMNGGRVAFRFSTQDGGYDETVFGLGGSKQALLDVLGRPLTVDPGVTE